MSKDGFSLAVHHGGLRSGDMRCPPEAAARWGRAHSPPSEDDIHHKNCVIKVGQHGLSRYKALYHPNLLPRLLFLSYTK